MAAKPMFDYTRRRFPPLPVMPKSGQSIFCNLFNIINDNMTAWASEFLRHGPYVSCNFFKNVMFNPLTHMNLCHFFLHYQYPIYFNISLSRCAEDNRLKLDVDVLVIDAEHDPHKLEVMSGYDKLIYSDLVTGRYYVEYTLVSMFINCFSRPSMVNQIKSICMCLTDFLAHSNGYPFFMNDDDDDTQVGFSL